MSAALWAQRGHLLQFDTLSTSAQCVGASRLGVVQVTAPAFSIWIQVRGDGWIESREGRFRMRRGDWMAFEKESAPLIQTGPKGICIGLALDARALDELQALDDGGLYAGRGRIPPRDVRALLRLWREAQRGSGDGLSVRPLLLQLAIMQRDLAARARRCPGRSRNRKRQVFGRMQRARLYLEGHSDRVVRISELADLTSFSSWYFSKAFHALYDESPQALSVRLRLERAGHLLRTTPMMVGEVAAATGFDNCCSFARAFKAHHGTSASRFRAAAGRQAGIDGATEELYASA
ncbi:AraC family transcriptional regulator [Luteimonas sp. FCS-9]|uniref:helix-turn-helix domain-containing protein n=1 Tax=Luteimonas sp. FCS-9 TaxID=1547516 RepID=UPI00063EA29A|nr:AraC family transcriptional regulator [Luteimonas sp. FCS-9]KLJ02505.1 AraC family transcriptional regulator [Luteimonas sp. FCS-9]